MLTPRQVTWEVFASCELCSCLADFCKALRVCGVRDWVVVHVSISSGVCYRKCYSGYRIVTIRVTMIRNTMVYYAITQPKLTSGDPLRGNIEDPYRVLAGSLKPRGKPL